MKVTGYCLRSYQFVPYLSNSGSFGEFICEMGVSILCVFMNIHSLHTKHTIREIWDMYVQYYFSSGFPSKGYIRINIY